MSPELASSGSAASQAAIAPASIQRPCTSTWLSPSAASKRVNPSAAQRASAASAPARARGDLERERRERCRQAGKRLGLETLDVDLDEGGRAMARDQRIERRQR